MRRVGRRVSRRISELLGRFGEGGGVGRDIVELEPGVHSEARKTLSLEDINLSSSSFSNSSV